MRTEQEKIVEGVLNQSSETIKFEEIPDETQSPLHQKVAEKALDLGDRKEPAQVEEKTGDTDVYEQHKKFRGTLEEMATDAEQEELAAEIEKEAEEEEQPQQPRQPERTIEEPLDAPEQEISEDPDEEQPGDGTAAGGELENFEVPLSHAKLMADTFMVVANNLIEVGGGIFVKIKKHKEFYEFEEVIRIIDEQNTKNVQRLKLDDEDKAMLRPLLVAMIRRKAKQASPEQLLLGAAISIIIKKYKVAMEMRSENSMLEARLISVIKATKGITPLSQQEEPTDQEKQAA